MDLTLTRPVQVALPASVANKCGPAYAVPAPITPTSTSGSLSPVCSPPASPVMPPSPSPSMSSSGDSSDTHSVSSSSAVAGASSSSSGLPSRPVAEFLFHLTRMLTDPSIRNLIEWTPQGSIRVHDPHTLENEVLGKYFRHSKYSSFQRQLNYFGFRKVGSKGRMSPCSYINDDTGDDLSSLLSIKRKTANRARSRKAQAEKEAAAKVVANVSDSDSCGEEAEQETEEKKVDSKKEKKEKKQEGGSKKRKKPASSSSSSSPTSSEESSPKKKSKKKKRTSSSSGSSSSSKQVKIEAKPQEETKEPAPLAPAAIAVTDIDFGPPGTIDFQAIANVSLPSVEPMPSPTASAAPAAPPALPMVSPAVSTASVIASPTSSLTRTVSVLSTSTKSNSSWEHLLLPQAASMPVASAPAAPSQPVSFQPVQQAAPVSYVAPLAHPGAPAAAPAPIAAVLAPQPVPQPAPVVPAPMPFVTKFNTPNPLAHLMAAPASAPLAPAVAPATAAMAAQESQQQQPQQQTPDIASGFSTPAGPATAAVAKVVNKPSYAVVPALELADEEISVEKLLSLEWTGVGPSTSSGQKKRGSFADFGDYTFPMLSPNSSLVDLAAIPTL